MAVYSFVAYTEDAVRTFAQLLPVTCPDGGLVRATGHEPRDGMGELFLVEVQTHASAITMLNTINMVRGIPPQTFAPTQSHRNPFIHL